MRLIQGSLSVAQYESHFTDLSQHATYMVDTEEKKVRQFIRGLRPAFQSMLAVLKLEWYRDVVERALIMERGFLEQQQRQVARRPDGHGAGGSGRRQRSYPPARPQIQKAGQGSRQQGPAVCFKCKK